METKCDKAQEMELKEGRRKRSLILKNMNLRGQQREVNGLELWVDPGLCSVSVLFIV